ncbi:MAG: AAA family ATPase [Kiloniellales bacterium]|nr:AAA family ATPase [Kiloniellales bacterium]
MPGDIKGGEPLAAERLCWRCDTSGWTFETTDDLEDLGDVIGQARAVEAILFAVDIAQPGYNIFALGPEGLDKHGIVRRFLGAKAAEQPAPADWCYVNNFREAHAPKAIELPPGRGMALKDDMARLVTDLHDVLVSAFESEEYRTRRQVIEEELKERQQASISEVEAAAKEKGLTLVRTPIGFAFAPVSEGKLVPPEVFEHFPKEARQKIETDIEALQKRLQAALEKTPIWIKETREKVRALNQETAELAVGHLIGALRDAYADLPKIMAYLTEVQKDVIGNVELFLQQPQQGAGPPPARQGEVGRDLLRRYQVNLIVHNGVAADRTENERPEGRAPVVYEDNPTFDRLLGYVEHRAELGALVTDFNMIRPGALHKANGGYLMLDARKVLTRPLAWDGLKRALFAKEIRTEPLAQMAGLLSTTSLEPEPIPLDVKIVLIGDSQLYYLLSFYDPEFGDLFKVSADFDELIDRSEANDRLYARQVATLVRQNALRPFGREAVGRVLEQAARQAGDAERLSAKTDTVADLLREADHWAQTEGRQVVERADVQKAVDKQIYRQDRVRQRMQEQITRGTVLIDDRGSKVGQINGLSVLSLGGFAFGRPSRITARVRLGRGDLVDIEREVELGGPLHSKGVLILRGFLSSHYASDRPLSLSASLVFEQSYGGVDGDSASSAELYALLSAIAEVPIKQSFAVTGSVNQHGEVQAIGGVNEKVEGFFDLCSERGLTGEQGVLIPASNVKHLMLRPDVIEAVRDGRFRVYPVTTIEQGIEILTGLPAGLRGADGRFPENSLNHKVEARLIALAEQRRAFARGEGDEERR